MLLYLQRITMIHSILKHIAPYIPENNRLERIWKLAQVDFKKRYYNDKLGLLWALLNPLFQIMIYYFIFKVILNYNKVDNYALFLFSGLLIWMAFSEGATKGLSILKMKKYLLENIQFNKFDLFYASSFSVFIGLGFNFMAYVILCYAMGVYFDASFFLFPILLLNLALIMMGTAMILATIQIYLKDIVHLWSIITLFGFWTSGVFFRGEIFLERFPPLLYIHPFVGIIMNMRAITMDIGEWQWYMVLVDMIWGISLFLIGRYLINKYSHKALENL